MLNTDEKALIAAAVAAGEVRTSGEILCAITEEVSDYPEVPLAWAAVAALILPPLSLVAGLRLEPVVALVSGWQAGHGAVGAGPLLGVYAVLQAVVFVVAMLVVGVPAVRRRLTPRGLKQRRVRRAAVQHFAGVRAYLEPGRTAVLVFASLSDRQMEIVADTAIDAAVGPGVWDQAVAEALAVIARAGPAEGLARAVTLCADALARHYPDDGGANVYPDGVVVL